MDTDSNYELIRIEGVPDTPVRYVRLLKSATNGKVTVATEMEELKQRLRTAWQSVTGSARLFTQSMPGSPPNAERFHPFNKRKLGPEYEGCYEFKDGGGRWRLFSFIVNYERIYLQPTYRREPIELAIGVTLRQVKKSGGKGAKGQQTDMTALDFVNNVRKIPEVVELVKGFLKGVTS